MAKEHRQQLEAELEAAERALRDALDFLNDDRHLTNKGITEREVLRNEIEVIKQDLEAVRQEHR
jgi:hypothetical protein